jgi:hypothetical protein
LGAIPHHEEEILVRDNNSSKDVTRIGWLLAAAPLVWLIPILLLGFTLGDYNRQIDNYAEAHQGRMPLPMERASMYASIQSLILALAWGDR